MTKRIDAAAIRSTGATSMPRSPRAHYRKRRDRHHLHRLRPPRRPARPPLAVPDALRKSTRACRTSCPATSAPVPSQSRRQPRRRPRGPHQGHRSQLRLGLQPRPPTRRRAAGRLRRDTHLIHIALDTERMTGPPALGTRAATEAVLRCHGHRPAASLGHGQHVAATPQWRQSRQQGTRRRHDALSARLRRRRATSLPATATASRATAKSASRQSKPA